MKLIEAILVRNKTLNCALLFWKLTVPLISLGQSLNWEWGRESFILWSPEGIPGVSFKEHFTSLLLWYNSKLSLPTLEEGKLFNACKARAVPKHYRIPCNPLSILKRSISPKGCNFFRHAYFCQRAYFGLCEDLALKHEESADLEERGYI